MRLPDQQSSEKCSEHAAHAADNNHNKCFGDDIDVHLQIGGVLRYLQRTRQASKKAPEKNDACEQKALIDSKRRRHFAVLRGSPDEDAPSSPMQDEPNGREHERSDGDQRKVVFGKELTGEFDGAAQPGRARREDFVGPPDRLHQILNNQDDREGGDNLEQSGGSINPPEYQNLHQDPDETDDNGGADNADPESKRIGW